MAVVLDPDGAAMSDCILWEGRRNAKGYGLVVGRLAHRVAWEEQVGPIPSGHLIHHECGTPSCVNVEHLRCITHAEHNALHLNASSWYTALRSRTHCPQGHEYTIENTRLRGDGWRACRECERARCRVYHAANRERLLPLKRERERIRRARLGIY